MDSLLSPFRLGAIDCRNRVAMAPCTRCMSPGFTPDESVAAYYGRRAADGVGLLITEGTVIAPRGSGYLHVPGIFDDAHERAWSEVTRRVHAAGGRIACQLWHVGAVAHPRTTGGALPESPSGRSPAGNVARLTRPDGSPEPYGPSEAMSEERILEVIRLFREGAGRAIRAGFDGVEIHGAHGYLVDQFINSHWNQREDDWGGENRFRFAAEVSRAVVDEVGADRAWIRISPTMSVSRQPWIEPETTLLGLLPRLWDAGLRILHGSNLDYDEPILNAAALGWPHESERLPLHRVLRRLWSGPLIGVGGLGPARADRAIRDGEVDMVAFGRALIANPDFVSRVRDGRELRPYDPAMLEVLD